MVLALQLTEVSIFTSYHRGSSTRPCSPNTAGNQSGNKTKQASETGEGQFGGGAAWTRTLTLRTTGQERGEAAEQREELAISRGPKRHVGMEYSNSLLEELRIYFE